MSKASILVVEDDPLTLQILESELQGAGYDVVGVDSSMEAIQITQAAPPDLMILDLSLMDNDPFNTIRDGFGVLSWLRRTMPEATFPVIIHTVNDSPSVVTDSQAHGVYRVFRKGGDWRELMETVRRALADPKAA